MSFDITQRKTSWGSRLFIEASAGTGKTFLIEHYLLRSLLFHGLQVEKVALITFTRAVANELKNRLRRSFETTAQTLFAHKSGYDYLSPILEGDEATLKRSVRMVEEGQASLSSAAITTIHGFCDTLLSKYTQTTEENWLSDFEKREWLTDYLREQTVLSEQEWHYLAKTVSYDQKTLLDRLIQSLEQPSDNPSSEPISEVVQRLRADSGRVASALSQKALCFRGNTKRDGSLREDVQAYFDALEKLLIEGFSDKRMAPLYGWSLPALFAVPLARPPNCSEEATEIATRVLTELWPSLQPHVDAEALLAKLSSFASAAFQNFLVSSGKKTPDSLLAKVLSLSEKVDFQKFVAKEISWLIVDEFQDTDTIQWTIFSNLFLDNPEWDGHLLFVGDPKQAIYGFRKADVYCYMDARQRLETEVATLSTNFRSTASMVEAQNRFFFGETDLFYLPKIQKSLPVVENSPSSFADTHSLSIQFPLFEGSLGKRRRWPHDEIETEMVSWMADEMIRQCEQGTPFCHQAILVKDRYQAKRVQEALQARKIPVFPWRLDSLTDSPIVGWLSLAFHLAEAPQDKKRLTSLLLYLPSHHHHTICHAISSERRLDLQAVCASEWLQVQNSFYKGGVGAFSRSLFTCRFNGSQTVHEWLSFLDPTFVVDVEHSFELLSLLSIPKSLEAYAQALEKLEAFFAHDPDVLLRRNVPNEKAAPLLTIHRSKGLEFDVIYSLGTSSRTPLQEEMAAEEADAEKIRQLYVAVTRAKKVTFLPLPLDLDEKPVPYGTASPLELALACHHGGPELYESIRAPILKEVVTNLSSDVIATFLPQKPPVPLMGEEAKTPQEPFAPSSLSYSTRHYRSFSQERQKNSTPICAQGSSAAFGIQFHAAIAKALNSSAIATSSPEVELLVQKALSIRLPINGKEVALQEIPREAMRIECPFVHSIQIPENQFSRGTIDLFFTWENSIFLLDWKTNMLPDESSTEEYLREHGYDNQYTMYRTAIEQAFCPEYTFGGFFFVFVRYLDTPKRGIIAWK